MREQIRLWFYSMLFMSTDADGSKRPTDARSGLREGARRARRADDKSAGNAIWFDEAAEKMGADVMRWIYCSQNLERQPELRLRAGRRDATQAADALERLLVLGHLRRHRRLRSDEARDAGRRAVATSTAGSLARLQSLVRVVRSSVEELDAADAVRAVDAFTEDLSNWYVRRSRRRFWKSGEDADKVAAHLTLYETLVTLTKVLAPFMPFLTEVMYQNLVRSVDPDAPVSVHLCRFPDADAALADDSLVADVTLVQRIVNLGRAARSKAAIKVRQPIGELLVKVAKPEEAAVVERLAPQILDELNVKGLKLVADLGELVSHTVRPRTPILGPKYGRELPKIVAALRSLSAADVASRVAKGESLELAGHTILAAEIEVMTSDREGFATAVEGDFAVAISTALTPALLDEGLARELVHRIQGMRKSAGFRIEDYIATSYEGDPDLVRVFERFASYVLQETLSRQLTQDAAGAAEYSEVLKLEGREVSVGVSRIR